MRRRRESEKWWAAARELGLELRDDSNGNTLVPHWDTMAASLRAHTELSQHNWMVGTWNGVQVLVMYYFRDGGSSADTHATYAIVKIDPPLFLGMHLSRRTWLSGLPKIGVPLFDETLQVRTFQPERGRAMVWPGRHPPLSDYALGAIAKGMHPEVYDSFAATTVMRFESDTYPLREMLTQSAAMASAAIERRVMIGETRDEAIVREAWARFAERERFTFDAPRRAVHGHFEGFETQVLTRSTPTAMWNQVLVALPTDSGIHVDVTPESGFTRFANVIGFSDIEVGDPAFDRALRVKGQPADRVRAFFANAEARAQAQHLVTRFGRFSVHGRFISVGTPRPAVTEAELQDILAEVTKLARAATGQSPPKPRPYRG